MALMNATADFGASTSEDSEYDAAVASGDIRNVMAVLEREYKLPAGYLAKTAQVESRMNPNAQNPRSSAGGLFQFLDSTAKRYGLTDKMDPVASTLAAAQLAGDNADSLSSRLGREPTTPELYVAHQQGAGGAAKILSNPSAPMASLVGGEAARLNGAAGLTGGQFIDRFAQKLGMPSTGRSVSTAPTADLPAEGASEASFNGGLMNRTAEAYQPAKQDNLLRNAVMALGQSIASGKRGDYTGGFSTNLNALQASDEKRDDRRYDMWRDQRNFGQTLSESARAQGNTDRNFDLQKTSNEIALKREGRADELERERIGLARKADTRAEAAIESPEKRKADADALGLTGNARVKYILTGKYESETPALSVSDRKAILSADEGIESGKGVLGNLKEAMDLSKKAYEGPTAGPRSVLTGMFGSEAGLATQNYDNVVTNNALSSLKTVFGGNPTEGERKILLDVAGSSSKPDAVRQEILKRAYSAAERRISVMQERANEMRGGTYYQPGNGQVRGTEPARAVSSATKPAAGDRFQALTAGGASKEEAYAKMKAEGY